MDESAESVIVLDSVPRSVAVVRRHIRAWLQESAPPDTVDDAVLIASELASNAVRHGGERFTVRLVPGEGCCRIEVEDSGLTTMSPVPAWPSVDAEQGRGLGIVSTLAKLGQVLSATGTTVVADLTWSAATVPAR